MLCEHFEDLTVKSLSSSAYTQARHKLKHKVFISLNRQAALPSAYQGDYETYHGHRFIAVDQWH